METRTSVRASAAGPGFNPRRVFFQPFRVVGLKAELVVVWLRVLAQVMRVFARVCAEARANMRLAYLSKYEQEWANKAHVQAQICTNVCMRIFAPQRSQDAHRAGRSVREHHSFTRSE